MSEWLRPLYGAWIDTARELLGSETAVVRVSIVERRGSAPREAGACLLVAPSCVLGSVGGGALEYQATQAARVQLVDSASPAVLLHDFTLGPDLNQCCGGRVQVWSERLTRADLAALEGACTLLREQSAVSIVTHVSGNRVTRQVALPEPGSLPALRVQTRGDGSLTLVEGWQRRLPALWMFGAGHVGQAIVRLLADLPVLDVTWIDARADALPAPLPSHVHALPASSPLECVALAPPGTRFLVLTHDHTLDYDLCREVLMRGDFAWLGLIGSASKRARFRSRLIRDGIRADVLARLTCPIGVTGIHSKLPAAIAVSVVAQLLGQLESASLQRLPLIVESATACTSDCNECGTALRVAR